MNNNSETTINRYDGDESEFTNGPFSHPQSLIERHVNRQYKQLSVSSEEITDEEVTDEEITYEEVTDQLLSTNDELPSPPKIVRSQPVCIHRWQAHDSLQIGSINYIIGKRGVGKTVLFNYLYSLIQDRIDEFFALTSTPTDYQSLTIESHIRSDPEHLQSLVTYFKSNPQTQRVLVIDSNDLEKLLTENHLFINELFMNGRHLGVTLFIISSYPYNMKPHLRANIDRIFIFREQNLSIVQKLYMQFGGCTSTLKDFKSALQMATCPPYQCLVIDNCDQQLQWFVSEMINARTLCKKTQVIKLDHYEKKVIEIDQDELNEMKTELKQLKSLCSKLLDRLNRLT